jgi:hypothetical protein
MSAWIFLMGGILSLFLKEGIDSQSPSERLQHVKNDFKV